MAQPLGPKENQLLDSLSDDLGVKDMMALELALADRGAGVASKLSKIAERFGVTVAMLEKFRQEHRRDIERCADELFASSKRIDLLVDQRAILGAQLVQAIMTSDSETEKKIRTAILALNELLPMPVLRQMKQIVGNEPDEEGKPRRGTVNVQINNSPQVRKAQDALNKLRSAKTVD